MAARKISQLEIIDILTGEELFPVARGGGNYKVRVRDLRSLFTKADLGLGNVDNTSDVNKPISTATQAALNSKAPILHTHGLADVQGLTTALSNKADVAHSHGVETISGLSTIMATKADTVHGHGIDAISGLSTALAGKAATAHSHNKSDIIGLDDDLSALSLQITSKAAAAHSHDISSITGLTAAFANKANSVHQHNAGEIQGLSEFVNTAIIAAGAGSASVVLGEVQW